MRHLRRLIPGSARPARAHFGAPAETILTKAKRTFSKVCDGEGAITSTRGRVRSPEFRIGVLW